jgi:hypothetical protein
MFAESIQGLGYSISTYTDDFGGSQKYRRMLKFFDFQI